MKKGTNNLPVYAQYASSEYTECGGTCGYHFSSGCLVSETVYSGNNASHGFLYNAASRVIIDGGRKAIAAAAMAGMLAQNLETAAYAITVTGHETVDPGEEARDYLVIGPDAVLSVYGSAYGTVLSNSGSQLIYSGGFGNGTRISGGGQTVYFGGLVSRTEIFMSGTEYVSGGTTYFTAISNKGIQVVRDGGITNNTAVYNGGIQSVYEGSALNTVVRDGGTQAVYVSGIASGASIRNSGWQFINAGGSSINVVQSAGGNIRANVGSDGNRISTYMTGINQSGQVMELFQGSATNFIINGGTPLSWTNEFAPTEAISANASSAAAFNIYAGGSAINTVINSGGRMIVNSGGKAFDTTINQNGRLYVEGTGIASGVSVSSKGNVFVAANGSAVGVMLNSSAIMNVYAGGRDYGTFISHGGIEQVYGSSLSANIEGSQGVHNGGMTNSAFVHSGGTQKVSSGAYTEYSEMQVRGNQTVFNSASAFDTILNSGGSQIVSSGGSAYNTIINSGGSQIIYNSGLAYNTVINSGGYQIISAGGSAINFAIAAGGSQINHGAASNVYISGSSAAFDVAGLASDIAVVDNGVMNVLDGGTAVYANIYSGGVQNIDNGGTASSSYIASGASQVVSNGGESLRTTVQYGGSMDLHYGGVASDTVVNPGGNEAVSGNDYSASIKGGIQNVYNGGRAREAEVFSNGIQNVRAGGEASGTFLKSGGQQHIYEEGNALSAHIGSGGIQYVYDGGEATSTVVQDGGTMYVYGGTAGNNGYTVAGGAIVQDLDVNSGGNVVLYGNGLSGALRVSGTLNLNNGGNIVISRSGSRRVFLNVDNLDGEGGTITMNVDVGAKTGDLLRITGNHTGGVSYISLKNTGSKAGPLSGNELKLVEYTNEYNPGNGTFVLTGGIWDYGGYEYELFRGDTEGDFRYDYYLRGNGNRTATYKAMTAAPVMTMFAVQTAMNSLDKRLGDLRNMGSTNSEHSIWARGYYKDMTVSSLSDTDMGITGAEAGYDFDIGSMMYSQPRLYLGLMAGSQIISDIQTGKQSSGEGFGFLGGAYATYIEDSGWFADFTLRAGQTRLDMISHTYDGNRIVFKPRRKALSLSAEIGREIRIEDSRNSWRIEPSIEFQHISFGKNAVGVKNGTTDLEIDSSSYNIGILSAYTSYSYTTFANLKAEIFADLSYRKTMSGDESISYDGSDNTASMKGGSVELRLGADMQFTKDVYGYASLSYEKGSKIKSKGIDAGIRFVFGGSRKLKYPSSKEVWEDKDKAAVKANAEKSIEAVDSETVIIR